MPKAATLQVLQSNMLIYFAMFFKKEKYPALYMHFYSGMDNV